jgi:hypothetical protein
VRCGVIGTAEAEGVLKQTEMTRYSAMTEADVVPSAGEE